ncbi:MAG: SH3 domain-containing protein [Christensenellaceae bacterium]|nr:SH3 domain-containing protein [Christensenellaceae bacterium]
MKKIFLIILAILLCASLMNSSFAEIKADSKAAYGVVTGGWLRLRSGPGYNYSTVASYATGTVVKIQSITGDWCRVETPDNIVGYMSRFYLTYSPGTQPEINGGGYNAYVYSPNGGPVRLRTGPSQNYGIIATYSYGTPLYVITHGINWDYIRIGSQYGYMMNSFIRTNLIPINPGGSSATYTAYVYSSNGYGVRLRSQPHPNAPILGIYSVGTSVTVLQHNYINGWDRIKIGSREGYMMNEFISTQNSGYNQNLVDFTLNKNVANVGDTLYITSISPQNASVNYTWKLDGYIIGNSDKLIVPNNASNKNISITISGKGNYLGTITKTVYINGSIIITNPPVTPNAVINLSNYAPKEGDTIFANMIPGVYSVSYYWSVDGVNVSYNNQFTARTQDIGKIIVVTAVVTNSNGTNYTTTTQTAAVTAKIMPKISKIKLNNYAPEVGNTIEAWVEPGASSVSYEWSINDNKFYGNSYTVQPIDIGYPINVTATITDSNSDIYTSSTQTSIILK